MNYYEHHLGDWAQATAHLTFLEDAAYSRCVRKYYADERPLPADVGTVQRLVGARTTEERQAVDTVLHEFFKLTDDGWRNKRCDEELARFYDRRQKAQRSANARWSRESGHTDGDPDPMRTHSERNANAMRRQCSPGTIHQAPDTNLHQREEVVGDPPTPQPEPKAARKRAAAPDKPPDVAQQVWDDWLALRARKRAPVTQTVLDGARSEAQKAGMPLTDFLAVWCMRGSQGLQADWLQVNERRPAAGGAETFRERDERLARERYLELVGRSPKPAVTVVDVVDAPARRHLA